MSLLRSMPVLLGARSDREYRGGALAEAARNLVRCEAGDNILAAKFHRAEQSPCTRRSRPSIVAEWAKRRDDTSSQLTKAMAQR